MGRGKALSSQAKKTVLDRESPLPLWAQLFDDLSSRLASGDFEADFPAELDVAAEYGVSRNTVREAMRRLRADGVVIAERGRRPRIVRGAEIEQPLGALYSLFASVEAAGHEQTSVVRRLEIRPDREVSPHLGLPEDTPLFYLERLRLAGGEPLALDRVWMPEAIGRPLLGADFTHTALYHELFRRTGRRLSTGSERIRAVIPAPADLELLELPPGAAALTIDRVAHGDGELAEWRETLIRGDRFSLVAEFSPRSGYQFDPTGMSAAVRAAALEP